MLFGVLILSSLSVPLLGKLAVGASGGGDKREDGEKEAEAKREAKMAETSKVLRDLLKDYDSRLRPNFGGSPVIVNVTMNVDSIGPISETEMSFRVDLSFRQMWYDERLSFRTEDNADITLSHEFLHKIWVPDTYFPESLSANKHQVMVPNVLLRLSYTGKILYSSRVTVVTKCVMDLVMFPLDTQVCSIMIEAYGYTTEHLRLQWHDSEDAVTMTAEPKLPQFRCTGLNHTSFILEFSTGKFSDLQVDFQLQRQLLYYVLQTYAPAILIVGLSWIGFWVDPKCIPARASLSITTVLTLLTLVGTVNSRLPKVSKVKALDMYFGLCFIYVFGALIEFALVCYLDKHFRTKANQKKEKEEAKKKQEEQLKKRKQMNETLDSWTHPSRANSMRTIDDRESSRAFLSGHQNGGTDSSVHVQVVGDTGGRDRSRKLTRSSPNRRENKRTLSRSISKHFDKQVGTFFRGERNFNILHVDNYARVFFPATFLIFNIIYWGYYIRKE